MFKKLKMVLEDSRKAQALAAGYIIKAVTMLGSFLAFVLGWSHDKVATWASIVDHTRALLDGLGTWGAGLTAVLATLIALEDSFRKMGIPWLTAQAAIQGERDPGQGRLPLVDPREP